MSRRHNEGGFSGRISIHRLLLNSHRAGNRGPDHLLQLANIFTRVVSVRLPDFQQLIKPSMVLGVLLSVIFRSETKQLDKIRLQRCAQGRERRCSVRVVFCVMQQVVQEI